MVQATQKHWIKNKQERSKVFIAIGLVVILILIGFWRLFHTSPYTFHTRQFKLLFINYGSLARIAFLFVFANYVFMLILQKHLVDRWNSLKKWVIALSRFTRGWHTPVAILAIGLILFHVSGAFLYGFEFDFANLSGLLALSVLLLVPISGLFRYRRMDRNWHLRLGLAFTALFLIHAL